MENPFTLNIAFEKFLNFISEISFVIYGILLVIFSTVIVLTLSVVYRKIRRKFPLQVNCWFCNNNTTIPYDLFGGWNCPYCEQYNGFDKNGDYNKIIPEQYNHKLNDKIFKTVRSSVESSDAKPQGNGFCKLCNLNQQLKIQQLALFVPLDENNYYEEIEEFREKLEKAYKLCSKCEQTLQETLEKQKYNLLQNRLNNIKSFLSPSVQNLASFNKNKLSALIKRNWISGLKIIQCSFAILLFLALMINFETEYHYLNSALPNFLNLEPLLPVIEILLHCQNQIFSFKIGISFAGLICCLLVHSESNKEKNIIILLAWGALYLTLWSPFVGLQIILSGVCLLLSLQMSQMKLKHFSKKQLPVKTAFQPVKKVFPETYNNLENEMKPSEKLSSSFIKSDSSTSLNQEKNFSENNSPDKTKQKLKNMTAKQEKKQKTGHTENEVESLFNEEKEKAEIILNNSPNSSFNNKTFMHSVEADKNCSESNGSFKEVFNNLNSLQLGGTQKKFNKPPNFLFAKHNFSDIKHSSSIIKPAKLIRNLNSTSWTEANESNSRSSTPSSGYSSQKPEKVEPGRYEFPKTMTPCFINSFSRHSPTNYFGCYDGNHGFYNNNHCFSPNFVPFQQFPNSLGQTTVYACSRPTNFPFLFSPWQGYSDRKISPNSSRFSDASDCDHLFQETSKKLEKTQKWLKLKSFFYYFSIFLNFITILSLVYFTSAGIILVDWKLPKFNFFL